MSLTMEILSSGYTGLTKALDHVSIHSPCHRADEAIRRGRRKRRTDSEDGEGQIKRMVADPFQVGRISFLEFQVVEPCLSSSLIPRIHEVSGDVIPVTSAPKQAIGMAVVPSPQPRSRTLRGGAISSLYLLTFGLWKRII
jgi:hypothetical protein